MVTFTILTAVAVIAISNPLYGAVLMSQDVYPNKINTLMCTTSNNGRLTYLTPYWSNLLGGPLQEIMATPFIEYVHPDDRDLTLKIYQQIIDGQNVGNFRNRYRTCSGEYVELQWVATSLPDGGLVASAQEIDDVVLVENKLKQHAVLFDQVSSLGKMGQWDVNFKTKAVFWSQEIYEIHGVTPEEYTPELESVISFYHPDDVPTVKNALAKGEDWNFTLRIVRLDGEIRTVRCLAKISRDPEGNPTSVFGLFQDVTDYEVLNKQVELLSHVANTSNAGVVICDNDRKVVWVNKAFTSLTGHELDEIMGMNLGPILQGPNTDKTTIKQIKSDLKKGADVSAEILNYHKNGHEYWNSLLISPVKDNVGNITHFVSIQNDISQKKQVEEKLKRAASVFTHAHEGIMITDASGTITEVNDAFSYITGYAPEEVLGKRPEILQSERQSSEFYAEMLVTTISKGQWHGEIWSRHKNGADYPLMFTTSAVKDSAGLVQHYVSLCTDISLMKEHHVQLERMAHYDVLTNLPNRVLLADRLGQALVQCKRRNKSLAVAFMDLDGFKAVNDLHGHNVGDQLLIEVSQRMQAALRKGDTLARIGGDEFIAVMVDLENIEDSQPVLKRLLMAAADHFTAGDNVMQVSASIGVTFYPQDHVDADLLMRHADQAMYVAKQAGKNRYHLFDTVQDDAINIQRQSIGDISSALNRREFVMHYQPKVNMQTGEVIGVEALIRWQHPVRGLVPPLEFLPVIEGHAVSLELGEWVIDTALGQISQWKNMGVNLPISVNISAYQLQQDNFTTRLSIFLAAHPDVTPHFLELEILETSLLSNISGVSATMNACHDLGVSFALDDFGTGYSSLTYLRRLPVNLIKIDQSFVRDMLEDAEDLAIIEGVLGLAKAFRRDVIAEGVETTSHGKALLKLGCVLAQGYGIARPMPAGDIPEWISSWKADDPWQIQNPIKASQLDN